MVRQAPARPPPACASPTRSAAGTGPAAAGSRPRPNRPPRPPPRRPGAAAPRTARPPRPPTPATSPGAPTTPAECPDRSSALLLQNVFEDGPLPGGELAPFHQAHQQLLARAAE